MDEDPEERETIASFAEINASEDPLVLIETISAERAPASIFELPDILISSSSAKPLAVTSVLPLPLI